MSTLYKLLYPEIMRQLLKSSMKLNKSHQGKNVPFYQTPLGYADFRISIVSILFDNQLDQVRGRMFTTKT